jgi:hypothetical protein
MKRFRLLFLLLILPAMWSCKDDWSFSKDSGYVLGFSVDTVRFDTVLTGVASATAAFKIYNGNDVGLRFDAFMGGGAASPFRMNLDGEGGSVISGLEVHARDSLFCYVTVNIPATGDIDPFLISDSVSFVLESGVVQCVRLMAHGQNTVPLKGRRLVSDTVFKPGKPYLIYDSLVVSDGVTLTLEPGTRLFFHGGAGLDVVGRLIARGTADSMVVMRGDRLDMMLPGLPYDLLNSQWEGVRLRSASFGNELTYCDIHGGYWGIKADSSGCDQTKIKINSSIIHNVKGSCIEATGCRIEVANSQITNGGMSCLDIAGGVSEFTFCTIAALSVWNVADQAVLLTDRRGHYAVPLQGASFRNCIITGRRATEFVVDVADSVRESAPFSVTRSLLMSSDTSDVRFSNVVFENTRNRRYGSSNFTDRSIVGYRSVFSLDSLSLARGIADSISVDWPVDLAGVPRPVTGADAGCYQYRSPE